MRSILKHFPCAPSPPRLAPVILACFTLSPEKASSAGTDTAQGCSPRPGGLKVLRKDGTHIWKCRTEAPQTPVAGCWVEQGICAVLAVLQRCPRPSLLAPCSLCCSDTTSEAEAVLELHEKKLPTSSVATPVLLQMGPARANTLLQSQTTSGFLPGCRSSLSPCATPLVPCHLSVCNPLALLGAVCPRAFVAAIAPVGIIFSFLLSDTGCSHNKTH